MLTTTYTNEQGTIDKVVLTAENEDDAKQLLDFVEAKEHKDYITASAAFYGKGVDPSLIKLEDEQAKLKAASAAYAAEQAAKGE